MEVNFCQACGSEAVTGARFCSGCGTPLPKEDPNPPAAKPADGIDPKSVSLVRQVRPVNPVSDTVWSGKPPQEGEVETIDEEPYKPLRADAVSPEERSSQTNKSVPNSVWSSVPDGRHSIDVISVGLPTRDLESKVRVEPTVLKINSIGKRRESARLTPFEASIAASIVVLGAGILDLETGKLAPIKGERIEYLGKAIVKLPSSGDERVFRRGLMDKMTMRDLDLYHSEYRLAFLGDRKSYSNLGVGEIIRSVRRRINASSLALKIAGSCWFSVDAEGYSWQPIGYKGRADLLYDAVSVEIGKNWNSINFKMWYGGSGQKPSFLFNPVHRISILPADRSIINRCTSGATSVPITAIHDLLEIANSEPERYVILPSEEVLRVKY